jgi:uncharacterized membrane protein (UPF0127 family)|tara:strand:- start:2736 stop:3071 length:336 start_codon:yes stop_codon:yes gene_type:complete
MNIILHNKEVPLELMTTPNEHMTGMMGREYLAGGMLFLFSEVSERSFWMKDCIVPLDIVFIVKNKVTKVSSNCLPCNTNNCKSYFGIGDKVLELPAGKYSIREGDRLVFNT